MFTAKIILSLYCFSVTTLLLITGAKNLSSPVSLLIFVFLLFILVYYLISFLLKRKFKKVQLFLKLVNFIFSLVILVAEIMAIRTTKDFIFTLIFAPIPLSFIILLAYDFYHLLDTVRSRISRKPIEIMSLVSYPGLETTHEDRRLFLKVLISAGAGVFLLSLLDPRKVGAAFFGSMPGPGTLALKDSLGVKIDPAIKSPTDSYGITDTSETSYPHYYGFVHYNGVDWYILNEASSGTYTYASKLNNTTLTYADAWSGKSTTTVYGAYSAAF